jgi:hypothetical protein
MKISCVWVADSPKSRGWVLNTSAWRRRASVYILWKAAGTVSRTFSWMASRIAMETGGLGCGALDILPKAKAATSEVRAVLSQAAWLSASPTGWLRGRYLVSVPGLEMNRLT